MMGVGDFLNRGQPREEVEEGAPAWMATFADVAILLMTFFALLLSFASMDVVKFRDMLGSVKDAFGAEKQHLEQHRVSSDTILSSALRHEIEVQLQAAEGRRVQNAAGEGMQEATDTIVPMEQALSVIEALFEGMEGVADVSMDENGITVGVEGGLLFTSGSAQLRPESAAVMERVSALLEKYTFDLHILGHTDSVPISTPRFPSNWELSSTRATAALRHLLERGATPQRLVAVGFADSRPIAGNDTSEDRKRNRRVEFLFKKPESTPSGAFRPARTE